ncbi:MAG: hypothetical protein ABEJ85_01350 [Haloarculaceae archaeon]
MSLLALARTPTIEAASSARPTAVFVSDSGEISLLYGDGSTASLGRSADVVGPMNDYDGDGDRDVVFLGTSRAFR